MSVVTNIRVPADDFFLGRTLGADLEIRVRLERLIPLGGTVIPYFWVANDGLDDIETALQADPNVDAFRFVDTANEETLVRVDWTDPSDALLESLAEADATVLEAVGSEGAWSLQLRFEDHEDLTEFYRLCAERGVSLTVERIHESRSPGAQNARAELTDAQLDTILAALEAGYFSVPRETNLVELAETLGVSDTAVSQRLRRGLETLIETTVDRTED